LRIACNGSTLGGIPLEAELEAAARAGFELVELRASKLATAVDPARVLESNGLRAWSVNSLERAGERDLREEARRQASWAAACGAPYVVCVPGGVRDGIEDALAVLAEICGREGAQLAFEFMGFDWSAIRTLADALRVHPGPVVIDTFHWALGDGDLDALARCDPARIAVVHVNDAPSGDLAALGDADRVLPGEGALDLEAFYATLGHIGYDGVYSVELFTPVSAERAFAAMTRLAQHLNARSA
jgi:2-keto-myo-inositol isomerase